MRSLPLLFVPLFALTFANLLPAQEPRPGASTKPEPASPQPYAESFLKEHDRNNDGSLQRDELPTRCRDHFAKLDTNKDGKLDREEVIDGLTHLYERRRPSDVVFVLVEMSDCDDGCAEEVQRVYSLMRKLDRDQDGKINAAELRAGREAIIQERVTGLFSELDADRDGKISKDEARGQIKIQFGGLDTNADGFITREELTAAASAKPEEKGPGDRKKDRP